MTPPISRRVTTIRSGSRKDSGERDNPLETLVLDHLIHSYSDLEDPFYLEYEYIRAYEEVVRWRARDNDSFRALFIGGGGYTFPRFLDAKYPKAIMDVVEIDPEVTRVSQEYLGLSETKRVRSFQPRRAVVCDELQGEGEL